jgi:protein-tyrosine phosphatase
LLWIVYLLRSFSNDDVVKELQLLEDHRITHIVNVASGVPNAFPAQFVYWQRNMADSPAFSIREHFDEALGFMRGAIEGGGRVLVHCNAGLSRSITLAVAYIMRFEGKSLADAFARVKAVRKSE